MIDLHAYPPVRALIDQPDGNEHLLQLCVRYRECPTEEVPVLYDECGCDDTRCAPNRILETYAFDVLVDPPLPAPVLPGAPELRWLATIALPGAMALAAHAASDRLYVAAEQAPGIGVVQRYHLGTLLPVAAAPRQFARPLLAIALSEDGTRMYAAERGATAADAAQLHVVDTTSDAAFLVDVGPPVDIPGSANATSVRIVELPAGGFATISVAGGSSEIQVWDAAGAVIAGNDASVAAVLAGGSVGSDGRLYALAAGALHHFDTGVAGLDPESLVSPAADPVDFEIGRSTGADVAVWVEGAGMLLRQSQRDGSNVHGVALGELPVALWVGNSASTAIVLTQGGRGRQRAQRRPAPARGRCGRRARTVAGGRAARARTRSRRTAVRRLRRRRRGVRRGGDRMRRHARPRTSAPVATRQTASCSRRCSAGCRGASCST